MYKTKPTGLFLFVIMSFMTMFFLDKVEAQGYSKEYRFLTTDNLVSDKNFYLLTVIDQTPEVKTALIKNPVLKELLSGKISIIRRHVTDSCTMPPTLLNDFFWKPDSAMLSGELSGLYNSNKTIFDKMVDQQLRPSGYYQRYVNLSNKDLLAKAWNQCFYGMDYILNQFGMGKKMRYAHIDSASYVVTSRTYRAVLKNMMASLDEISDSYKVFYKPSLEVAMQLMAANDRDEPSRLEPLEEGINKEAYEQIKKSILCSCCIRQSPD